MSRFRALRFRALLRATLREMLRARALRVAATLMALIPPAGTWALRTSGSTRELLHAAESSPGAESSPLPAAQAGVGVSMIVLFTVYVFILVCGSIITTSVALERTSKVSIMVFRHVNPLMVVGARLTALAGVVSGLVGLLIVECAAIDMLGLLPVRGLLTVLGLADLTTGQLAIAGACALGGVVMFALLYAVVGLFVRDSSQLQYAQFPVSLLLIAVFTLSYVAVLNPASTAATVASWLPLSAPMVESGRIIAGTSSMLEEIGSATGVAIFLLCIALTMARVVVPRTVGRYSAATLTHSPHHRY